MNNSIIGNARCTVSGDNIDRFSTSMHGHSLAMANIGTGNSPIAGA